MARPSTSDEMCAAFLAEFREFNRLLADVQSLAASRFGAAPDAVDWGHVASLRYATDQLREILAHYRVPRKCC